MTTDRPSPGAERPPAPSAYGMTREVKVRGRVVGYLMRTWEGECAIEGCMYQGGIVSSAGSKGIASKEVRDHFLEVHAEVTP